MRHIFSRFKLVLAFLLLSVSGLIAQEKLTLTAAVTQPSITDYQVDVIRLSRSEQSVLVELKPNATATNAPVIRCVWQGTILTCSNGFSGAAPSGFADAFTMLKALIKANLTSNSLEKRVYTQLTADGAFAGSVTGSPQ